MIEFVAKYVTAEMPSVVDLEGDMDLLTKAARLSFKYTKETLNVADEECKAASRKLVELEGRQHRVSVMFRQGNETTGPPAPPAPREVPSDPARSGAAETKDSSEPLPPPHSEGALAPSDHHSPSPNQLVDEAAQFNWVTGEFPEDEELVEVEMEAVESNGEYIEMLAPLRNRLRGFLALAVHRNQLLQSRMVLLERLHATVLDRYGDKISDSDKEGDEPHSRIFSAIHSFFRDLKEIDLAAKSYRKHQESVRKSKYRLVEPSEAVVEMGEEEVSGTTLLPTMEATHERTEFDAEGSEEDNINKNPLVSPRNDDRALDPLPDLDSYSPMDLAKKYGDLLQSSLTQNMKG